MRQHWLKLLCALFLSACLSGCVFMKVREPLDTDTASTVLGAKEGRASSHAVLWLVAWGDSGTKAAAENGGITTVNHLDIEYFSVFFGAYSRRTTIAYGD